MPFGLECELGLLFDDGEDLLKLLDLVVLSEDHFLTRLGHLGGPSVENCANCGTNCALTVRANCAHCHPAGAFRGKFLMVVEL